MIKIENLKNNWCPVCNQELNWNEERELLECSQCDYAITKEQFTDYMDEILAGEYKVNTVDDNLSQLNNL